MSKPQINPVNLTKGSIKTMAWLKTTTLAVILTNALLSQEIVATHYDFAGNPDGWMTRSNFSTSNLWPAQKPNQICRVGIAKLSGEPHDGACDGPGVVWPYSVVVAKNEAGMRSPIWFPTVGKTVLSIADFKHFVRQTAFEAVVL